MFFILKIRVFSLFQRCGIFRHIVHYSLWQILFLPIVAILWHNVSFLWHKICGNKKKTCDCGIKKINLWHFVAQKMLTPQSRMGGGNLFSLLGKHYYIYSQHISCKFCSSSFETDNFQN